MRQQTQRNLTAREIAVEAAGHKKDLDCDIKKEWWIDSVEFRIKEYAEALCREQRELCALQMGAIKDYPKIRNASKPESL